jgi:hypothetical protein
LTAWLQQDFLDIVRREAAFGERRAHVKAKFIPLAERDHGADHQHAPGALIEMRPGPDFAPGMARDQIDELGVERILVGDRFIDPGIAEHLAALCHAFVAAFLIVHAFSSRLVRSLSLWERAGVRGYALSLGWSPSPGAARRPLPTG